MQEQGAEAEQQVEAKAAPGLEELRRENEALRRELRKLRAKKDGGDEVKREILKRQEMEIDPETEKSDYIKLFKRLAAQKNMTKAARNDGDKKDAQICILTEHIEKLMATLKQEGLAKAEAKARTAKATKELQEAQAAVQKLRSANEAAKRRVQAVEKRDALLEGQLQMLDRKYQALFRTHQTTKAYALKKEKFHALQIEQISNWVWETNNKVGDMVTARTNTLLSTLKLFESIYGQMGCAVLDFQECMLGDTGVKALARAIHAIVARQNQRKEAMQQAHAKRFEAWNRAGGHGPIPSISDSPTFQPAKACLLNLSFNDITDKGLKSLAISLAKCRSVTEIDLRGNRITKRSLPVLADTLMYNGHIEAVDLSGNYFTKIDLAHYIERLARPEPEVKPGNSGRDDAGGGEDGEDRRAAEDDWDLDAPTPSPHQPHDHHDGGPTLDTDNMPILTATDTAGSSFYRYEQVPRPHSAPPRPYTTGSERDPGAFLPRHAFHSQDAASRVLRIRSSDVLRRIDTARLYPPQKSPYSAMARITLDSLSAKSAQEPGRRIRPRPESAMISRDGGQELPVVANAMSKKVTGRPASASLGSGSKTTNGKLKFTPSKLRNRLQVAAASDSRGGPARGPVSSSGEHRGATSASRFSPSAKDNNKLPAAAGAGAESSAVTNIDAIGIEYAPSSMQGAFAFARKGNVGGILNLMKKIEPNPLLNKAPVSFQPNMRQAQTGETVIMHAARASQKRVIELMLEKRADINALSLEGWSALHHAVDAGQIGMISVLAQYGINVNLGSGRRDGTALHLAIRLGRLDAICALMSLPAIGLELRDAKGRTALHLATLTGKAHLVRLLRERGAKVRSQDKQRRTALDYAEYRNDLKVQEALLC